MTQEKRRQMRFDEEKTFIETNKRNPSKYVAEERNMVNFQQLGKLEGLRGES